jgi:hypothetical protein
MIYATISGVPSFCGGIVVHSLGTTRPTAQGWGAAPVQGETPEKFYQAIKDYLVRAQRAHAYIWISRTMNSPEIQKVKEYLRTVCRYRVEEFVNPLHGSKIDFFIVER